LLIFESSLRIAPCRCAACTPRVDVGTSPFGSVSLDKKTGSGRQFFCSVAFAKQFFLFEELIFLTGFFA
jgi:hypothetical protein